MARLGKPLPELLAQYVVNELTGCWLWSAGRDGRGYGVIWLNGKNKKPHRLIYERERGPVPKGRELDHLCCNPRCVNPAHMEPVTHAENIRRGWTIKRGSAA